VLRQTKKSWATLKANVSWDDCFMDMAETVSKRSKDPSTQVGAVLVSQDNNRVSVGYNGFPAGLEETKERWSDKHSYVVHAEMNAVLNARGDLRGYTLYTTMFPCINCTKLILQAGISRIVYKDLCSKSIEATVHLSEELFKEMDVSIERHNGTN